MTSATHAFTYASITAFAGCVFVVLHGFIRIRFCFTVAVAIMVFSGFGFGGLDGFRIVMRHGVRYRRHEARCNNKSQNHKDAN
mgnify:CR=1 FL=1